jgi:hypothetical protein
MARCAATGAALSELLIERSQSGGKERFSEALTVIVIGIIAGREHVTNGSRPRILLVRPHGVVVADGDGISKDKRRSVPRFSVPHG